MPVWGSKHSLQCRKYTIFFRIKKEEQPSIQKSCSRYHLFGLVWRYYLTATTLPEWRSTTIA